MDGRIRIMEFSLQGLRLALLDSVWFKVSCRVLTESLYPTPANPKAQSPNP